MSVTRQRFKNLAGKFVNTTFADFTSKLTIQLPVQTSDGQGGYTVTWTTFATVLGFVKRKAGKGEYLSRTDSAQMLDVEDIYMFQFQYVAGVTEDMRILRGTEVFNVKTVDSVVDKDVWLRVAAIRGEPT